MANEISVDERRRGAYGRDQIGEVIAGQTTTRVSEHVETTDIVLRYLHEDEEHQTGVVQSLVEAARAAPEGSFASGAALNANAVDTGIHSETEDPFVNSTFSPGNNAGTADFAGLASGSESDAELQSYSEGSISGYSFGIGEDSEFSEPVPSANPSGPEFGRASNGSSLGRFQEHFAPEENLAIEGPLQPVIPAEGPPPYVPYAPIDPTGTLIFPPRPPGFYIPIYHTPGDNLNLGPDAFDVRGIHISEEVPSFVRSNFGLPLGVNEIYRNPGQGQFGYPNSGLAGGNFAPRPRADSYPISRFFYWLKHLNLFKKSRSAQPDGSETGPATPRRPSAPTWFQKWKRGHDERSRIRRETTARIEAYQGERASALLDPSSAVAAVTKHKAEAIKLAREQGAAVKEMCRRAKTECPPYEFEELIGKGAYGRVYKGHQLPSQKVVAVKVLDIDSLDYKTVRDFKDESIKDFIHETKVMKQVKDSGAKNINELIEAISIHSQLWLVCEYCPGGSVRTLMRGTGDKLEERFIIPVARELAIGLQAIHDAGIIHRDIKAANVLIHEEGRLQICDFGVAGVLQSRVDKRSTWIGTPHWMPPEMFSARGEAHQYGSEIDVWAYGCTLFEFATGNPPNSNLRERMQIGRQLNRAKPKLDKDGYSQGLKDLVNFSLDSDPKSRPTMADIVSHSFIAGTEESHPTSSLSELVRIYYQWSQRGGQRISLFHPGGAAAAEVPDPEDTFEGDWNFSTTDNFEKRFSVIDLDQLAASLAEMEDEISPTKAESQKNSFDEPRDEEMSTDDKINFDERVRRGAEAMEGLFDGEKPDYKYETKNDFVPIEQRRPPSDLPLRTETDRSSVTSTFIDIDIGSFDSSHYAAGATTAQPIQLADADTIKANRSSGRQQRNSNEAQSQSSGSSVEDNDDDSQDLTFQPQSGPRPPTMDWKFPAFMQLPQEEESKEKPEEEKEGGEEESTPEATPTGEPGNPVDKRATMEWTFPSMATSAGQEEPSSTTAAADPSRFETLRAPLVTGLAAPSDTARPLSIGEPGDDEDDVIIEGDDDNNNNYGDDVEEDDDDEIIDLDVEDRPSTSHSMESSFTVGSEADYDPFRLDRPTSPSGVSTTNRAPSVIENDFPEIIETGSTNGDDDQYPTILDGPGPDEEDSDTVAWSSDDGQTAVPTPNTAITISENNDSGSIKRNSAKRISTSSVISTSEPFPTAIPSNAPTTPYDSPVADATSRISRTRTRGQRPRDGIEAVQFPDLVPPSMESMAAGVEDGVLAGELDRLLGDFLDALAATGDAMDKATGGNGGSSTGSRGSGSGHGHSRGRGSGNGSGLDSDDPTGSVILEGE